MAKLSTTLRIELLHIKPLIWRRLVVSADIQLPKLHKVIQAVMGWENAHLHAFDFSGTVYGLPEDGFGFRDDSTLPEKGVRLTKALGTGAEFEYSYDFGDDWQHRIIVESIGSADDVPSLPVCVAGENACPPEDVGGPLGYAEFVEAISDKTSEQYQEYIAWAGGVFDPAGFDVNTVNARLRAIR
jgi:Plasmid pRiA4b ORF-3-like protein